MRGKEEECLPSGNVACSRCVEKKVKCVEYEPNQSEPGESLRGSPSGSVASTGQRVDTVAATVDVSMAHVASSGTSAQDSATGVVGDLLARAPPFASGSSSAVPRVRPGATVAKSTKPREVSAITGGGNRPLPVGSPPTTTIAKSVPPRIAPSATDNATSSTSGRKYTPFVAVPDGHEVWSPTFRGLKDRNFEMLLVQGEATDKDLGALKM